MNKYELPRPLLEIESVDSNSFLKIAETLTRCGIKANREPKPILWQSCHILHKQSKYYITHFKEMFILDGKSSKTNIDDFDYDRRNLIAQNLENWGLIKIINDFVLPDYNISITIIPFKDKDNWELKSKYTIGKIHKHE